MGLNSIDLQENEKMKRLKKDSPSSTEEPPML